MNNIRFYSAIVTAMAVGTFILICSADARPGKTFARYGRHVEDARTAGEPSMPVAGKATQLAGFRGKAVLLNFWATWCGPCKIEMPWLVDLQKKYGPQGLQIVGVAMDDTSDKEIADFTHKMGVNYVVLKGTEKVGDLYGGVDRLPLTYFVDRSGKVVDEIVGLRSASDIEDAIKKTLAQGN